MKKSKPDVVAAPYQSTSTFAWQAPPDSPDIKALRDLPSENQFLEPVLQAQFDRNKQKVQNRLESSYNQNIPQAVRENTAIQANTELANDYGTALAQGAYNDRQVEMQKKLAIAGLTRPQLVQTGSSGYNSQVVQNQGGGFWGSLVGAGITAGIAA